MTIRPKNTNFPRLGVFAIDVFIVISSILFAYLLRFNFSIPDGHIVRMTYSIPLVLVVRIASFLISKTYVGIIYHTSTQDAKKIFFTIAIGSGVFVLSNIIIFPFWEKYIFSRVVIIIDFLMTTFLMSAFRVFAKIVYENLRNSGENKRKVIIYGAGSNGVMLKRALERDRQIGYEVVAFFDDNPKLTGNTIEGIKIRRLDTLNEFIDKESIDQMIIAIPNLSGQKKEYLVDICLQYKVKTLHAPAISNWANAEFNINQLKPIKIEDLLEREPIVLDKKNIKQQIEDKVVMITGAAGSIGSEIVRQLTPFNPKQLILVDQAETPLYEIEQELLNVQQFIKFVPIVGDIQNKKRMQSIFEQYKPEVLYHAAAYKHVPMMEHNAIEAIQTNLGGTKVLADLVDEFQVKKMVYVSSDKAVNPANIMGATKRLGEIYVQLKNESSNTQYITTRFGNVLGSNGSVIPLFKKQIEQGGPVTITDPAIERFFMTIPEACQLVLEAGAMGEGGEVYLFDMGDSVKILDLAKKMIRLSGLEENKDITIQYTGLRPGEKLYEELINIGESTLSTHHPKIMIAKLNNHSAKEDIEKLLDVSVTMSSDSLVNAIKELVPEYHQLVAGEDVSK